jgi:UDP:flavonoid glycosyltransferase YjiC (YdhE family)
MVGSTSPLRGLAQALDPAPARDLTAAVAPGGAGECVFVVNGIGLGNSTRCHAVIEHLAERGVRVHVLTSGNGLEYFRGRPEVQSLTATRPLFYGGRHGRISGWRTVAAAATLLRRGRAKERDLDGLLARRPIDAVVTDSEYFNGPARRRGIPVIGLNNSDAVVTEYLGRRHRPRTIRSQFWLMEFPDYLLHRHRCDLVISPWPVAERRRHPRIRRVGLIVRRAVRALSRARRSDVGAPRALSRVVFMLSGSEFASAVPFGRGDLPFRVDVVGRPGVDVGTVRFHGRLMDNGELLGGADALVINAGFSAVSEAIALGKPTFVIPLANHAEQYVNAQVLSQLGRGYVAEADTVVDTLRRVHAEDRWDTLPPPAPILGIDGGEEAADVVCEVLAWRRGARRTWRAR